MFLLHIENKVAADETGTARYNNGHEHFLLCAFAISVFISIIKGDARSPSSLFYRFF